MKIIKTLAFVLFTALICFTFNMLTVGLEASPVEAVSKALAGDKGHDVEYVVKDMGEFSGIKVSTFYDINVEYDPSKSGKVCYRVSKDYKDMVQIEVVKGVLTFSTKKTVGATKFKNWEKKISKISVYTSQPLGLLCVEGSGDIEVKDNVPFADDVTLSILGSGDIETKACKTSMLSVQVSGAGDIELEGMTQTESFNAQILGSGDIEVTNITTGSCGIQINGSGDITLKGNSKSAEFMVNGSGDIKGGQLVCGKVEAQCSGSGDIEIYAKDSATVAAYSSGNVKVLGNPQSKTTDGNKGNIIFR